LSTDDELGVPLYDTRKCLLVRLAAFDRGDAAVAPYQNATGLQATSAAAGMVWASKIRERALPKPTNPTSPVP
jgi:homospermidine synthase